MALTDAALLPRSRRRVRKGFLQAGVGAWGPGIERGDWARQEKKPGFPRAQPGRGQSWGPPVVVAGHPGGAPVRRASPLL